MLRPEDFPEGVSFDERLAEKTPLPACTSSTRRSDIGGLPPRIGIPITAGDPTSWKLRDEVEAVVIKGGEITIKLAKRDETAKFTLDPSQKPAHIDIMPKGEDEKVPGIYETKETDKGLELTIAFGREGSKAERPKDIKGGENVMVLKLLRKKEK